MERPKVGIGVIVIKDKHVLLGKRKGAHGEGTWSFPGGHLEFSETWEECALRETEEETGLQIANVRFATVVNSIFHSEQKHYVTIYMRGEYVDGEPETKEPEKFEKWEWFSWDELPKPLFLPIQLILENKYTPF